MQNGTYRQSSKLLCRHTYCTRRSGFARADRLFSIAGPSLPSSSNLHTSPQNIISHLFLIGDLPSLLAFRQLPRTSPILLPSNAGANYPIRFLSNWASGSGYAFRENHTAPTANRILVSLNQYEAGSSMKREAAPNHSGQSSLHTPTLNVLLCIPLPKPACSDSILSDSRILSLSLTKAFPSPSPVYLLQLQAHQVKSMKPAASTAELEVRERENVEGR
jgi:hypothetical protein